ncbi:MAG: NAD(+) diphosphatase [Cyanobacteria bacterium P01_F01_bin.150]
MFILKLLIPRQPFTTPSNFIAATAPNQVPDGAESPTSTKASSHGATSASTCWFVCQGSSLMLMSSEPVEANVESIGSSSLLPSTEIVESMGLNLTQTQFLGYLDEQPCIAVALPKDCALAEGGELCNLRSLYGILREDWFAIASRAIQIIEWDRTHRYCGQCATPTIQLPHERAKRCPDCGLRQYPRLSPAVIMLVYRGDELLLARAPRFRNGMYSVLAGFVEPGESLEEAVAREVYEEVGIQVKNIRYFGSQPWPFPNSLMVGFVAEYDSGELNPDPAEIEAVEWFTRDYIPPVPGKLSIARKLIDAFMAGEGVLTSDK